MADTIGSQLFTSLMLSTKSLFPNNKVIRAQTGGAEPQDPYVSLRIIRDRQLGLANIPTLLSNTNQTKIQVNWEALVQFTFTSIDEEDAFDLAKTFVQYLNTPLTREIFRSNKLSWSTVSPIRNVNYVRESVWTQHYNVDVTFYYAATTLQTIVPIEVVEMTDLISGEVYTVPPDVIIDHTP